MVAVLSTMNDISNGNYSKLYGLYIEIKRRGEGDGGG